MKGLTEKVGATDILAAIIVVAVGLYFVWPSEPAKPIDTTAHVSFDPGISTYNKAIATKAMQALINVCPNFKKYWPDVVGGNVHVSVNPDLAYPYMQRRYGWHSFVDVTFTIRDAQTMAPARWHMWGHTLYYELGGGDVPGVVARKSQSAHFCNSGMPIDQNGDGFLPNRQFLLVDQLK